MKKVLLCALLWSVALFGGGIFSSCSDDPDEGGNTVPENYLFEVEVESTTAYSVNLKVTSEGIADYAYMVTDVAQPLEAIYASGVKRSVTQSPDTFSRNGFEPTTSYTIYFAARQQNDKFYPEVVKVEFTTGEFDPDSEITTYNVTHNSFNVFINFPDEVAARGNVLKWAVNDYAMFNDGWSIAHKMNLDDEWYAKCWFNEDYTLSISNNAEDRFTVDEYGTISEMDYYYEPLVPGNTYYFTVGEYEYVDEDEMYVYDPELGFEVDNTDGHAKPGYYKALFDQAAFDADNGGGIMPWRIMPLSEESLPDQSQYWYGYYRIVKVKTLAPELLEGDVTVDLSGLKPNGGTIKLTPDANVPLYAAAILAPSTWEEIQTYCVDEDPATLQAYLTTTHAYMGAGIGYYSGEQILDVADEVWVEGPGSQYKLAVIALNGEEMTAQRCTIYDITLPELQMEAPSIEVKAIANPAGEESPYELWFNVKCTSVAEGIPALTAQYAFNMEREWKAALEYSSMEDVILYAYNYFDEGEVAQMNTEAGCNVCFATMPGQKYGFGAVVLNEEGTNSMAGYAEATAKEEELPARVESDYFSSLKGDWTLSATIEYTDYDWDTWEEITVELELQTKVTIGDLTLPESLSEEIYSGFENSWMTPMGHEEVDAAYAELKEAVANFNKQTRDRNRLLCQGYDLYPALWGSSATKYNSAYDLFYRAAMGELNYNGASATLFDFGPKWYIEVDDQGNLRVPFNSMTMAPAANYESTYFIAGINTHSARELWQYLIYDPAKESTAYFPIKVEGDKLTIEPYVYDGDNYYMHLVDTNGYAQGWITSEITLTKGWTPSEEPLVERKPKALQLKSECRMSPVQRPKATTRFAAPVPVTQVTPVTVEQYRENLKRFFQNRP
uniref:hypothetical protein n=1 Tax=Alistipes sp. TaxID=1872444 RepID=UPI0040560CD6